MNRVLLVVAVLLLLPVAAAGPNPEIGYVSSTKAASGSNGATFQYSFQFGVAAADGRTSVHLDLSYDAGDGRIAPNSVIRYRPSSDPTYQLVGNLGGFQQTLRLPNLPAGSDATLYFLRVESTVQVPEAGDYVSHLRMVARDPQVRSSSPGVIYPFTYTITSAPTTTSPTGSPPSGGGGGGGGSAAAVEGPGQVVALRLVDVATTSAELAWNAAERAASYQVHRSTQAGFTAGADTLVATTTGLGHRDTGLTAGTTYHYRVVAVDAQGRTGLASVALEVRTTQPPTPGAPPSIFDLRIQTGAATTISWRTDRVVEATLSFGQGTALSARTPQRGQTFTEALGDLPSGTYQYRIDVRADDGATRSLSGRVTIEPSEEATKFPAPDGLTRSLQNLGLAVGDGDLLVVDRDGDGRPDAIEDTGGRLVQTRAFDRLSLFLMRDAAQRFYLLDTSAGEAHATAPVGGDVKQIQDLRGATIATVEVPDKSGWILVSLTDFRPKQAITGVFKGQDQLPADLVWRDTGQVVFLDDPVQTYTLYYAPDADAAVEEPVESIPGAGFLIAAAALALALLARRR